MNRKLSGLALGFLGSLLLLAPGKANAAGTWQPLAHQPPFNACAMELLTDGTIFVQAYYTDSSCWKLTPDVNGNYVNGTWSQMASMHDYRLYYAGSVFADGRVFVSGGEYSSGGSWTNHTEIYNPQTNVWTTTAPPTGWANVGDAPCTVMADGRLLMGSDFDARTAIFDPTTNAWTAGPNKFDSSSDEETWALLPDNTVLAVMAPAHPGSEKYLPIANAWIHCPNLPVDLVDASSEELGPSLLMPNGTLFCTGATPHTAIYTPPINPADPGTWAVGPTPPSVGGTPLVCADTPMAMLPNGKTLICMGVYSPGGFASSIYACEYDSSSNSITQVPTPGNSNANPYNSRMLVLPSGQVMFTTSNNQVYIYTPDGSANPAWAPHITNVATTLAPGTTYPLQGTQLNGISQGQSYGDDYWAATNYPLVRIQNNVTGHVTYCRTFGHSTMGVATGSAIVSTNFVVPASIELGASTLTCVANGIPSTPVNVNIGSQVSGTITLQSYVGAMPSVTVEVRVTGTTSDIQTFTITPSPTGAFSFTAPANGHYDFAFKASHWLKKTIRNVAVNGGASGLAPSLLNGDCNGDNAISMKDLLLIQLAYGSTSITEGWNPLADLNGDGTVNILDLNILKANYPLIGDR